ncbi:UDP-glucose/GDP-mannose dehydrogenase family, NAD binding domain-containing protein [Xylariales sp. PMI_506]|nr:UDP-glucose/GDP-mannose dehydrogenase family, NAD binding domain-containing protein [Xylariales sp. PMI_506]
MSPISHICFIGAGYVGGPTAAVIARNCPDIEVTVVDKNVERIEAWKSEELPISEPDLLETVKVPRDGLNASRRKNLVFTTQIAESIDKADIIMARGAGSDYALDIGRFEEVALTIANLARSDKIVVEKSTVPVGTGQNMRQILNNNARSGVTFEVLSNPEFLAEGTAIQNLLSPDRILIGSQKTKSGLRAAEALANVYTSWVPRSRIITTNLFSSELSKLAANALLAQRISSVNALSAICEATGADIQQVSQAIGSDTRIGPHMLRASFGFGGSCFKKDVRSLVYLCISLHLDEVAAYWQGILDINEHQKCRSVSRVVSRFHNSMTKKKIAVLGFAFKENTGDTRESCSIDIVKGFLREGASVRIYDPCVKESQIYRDLGPYGAPDGGPGSPLQVFQSAEEACEGAHAVVVLRTAPLDWHLLAKTMKYPKLVFGSSAALDADALIGMGFDVELIGSKSSDA